MIMTMLFFMKPFHAFDADIVPPMPIYEEPEKKKKKRRRVYRIKNRKHSVNAKELSAQMEARRELEKVVREKLIQKINNERRERIKRVITLLESLEDDDLV